MARIFISYRRDDSAGHAGRLYDQLIARLGKDTVFMDVNEIALGADFVDAIELAVRSADILLVVIGKHWLTATDVYGRRRLDQSNDYVQLEIGIALNKPMVIIPVLVEGVAMPPADELPAHLQKLARINALELRHASWYTDFDNLIQNLERLLYNPQVYTANVLPLDISEDHVLPLNISEDHARQSKYQQFLAGVGMLIKQRSQTFVSAQKARVDSYVANALSSIKQRAQTFVRAQKAHVDDYVENALSSMKTGVRQKLTRLLTPVTESQMVRSLQEIDRDTLYGAITLTTLVLIVAVVILGWLNLVLLALMGAIMGWLIGQLSDKKVSRKDALVKAAIGTIGGLLTAALSIWLGETTRQYLLNERVLFVGLLGSIMASSFVVLITLWSRRDRS